MKLLPGQEAVLDCPEVTCAVMLSESLSALNHPEDNKYDMNLIFYQ